MGKSRPMDISSDYDSDHPSIEHPRSIVHIDVDYFYAQVEMMRHPEFQGKPLGVQQKNIVVTCNYEARAFGVKKCMLIEEALRLCPSLILVKGEDLTPYRRMSAKILELLHQFTSSVEKLGLDENFIDVTSVVNEYTTRIGNNSKSSQHDENTTREESTFVQQEDMDHCMPVGKIFSTPEEECPCGCHTRLAVASSIAMDMRSKILNELGLTCSAGIAHNKLLAKLGGAVNKPNQQTVVYPCSAASLLSSLGSVSKIPGVGRRTAESLTANNILTVDDVRKTPLERLQVKIGKELARKIKDYAEGIDDTPVKPSGRPQSIGLEDGFKKVSLVDEVESRLSALLRRLTELAAEDGRIPICLKLTVRKQDSINKPAAAGSSTGKRESRQCAIPSHLVPSSKGAKGTHLYDHTKILALVMKLFHRVVDISKPFHLTLLGLAFTKFQEEKCSGKNSIASFLRKQVAVQSVMDISSEDCLSDVSLGSPMSISNQQERSDCEEENDEEFRENKDFGNKVQQIQSNSCHRLRNYDRATPSPIDIRYSGDDDEDILSEVEPSPKKTKLEVWLSGRRESPSIEMADLRLNTPSSSPISKSLLQSGPTTFKSTIPIDLDKQVNHSWPANTSGKKPNDIFKYFIANK
ncbi:polymerase (DNA directed) iota isoform X1 [Nasonia vitripennis]|uniref:UmuC domain-containing protein n=1 Tax=Nasonia vitripennis TaxID=7425 RepID=A0A7M6UUW1_NASVI|nr:polymerase (DNA directed) iota [Nasonia vitripennis]XP_031784293.1 polymerase (DNA directed) iota isoform X1 [Nasonia vitripennis]